MRAVLEFLSSLAGLLKLWLGVNGTANAARLIALLFVTDAGGEWVRSMGGTDRRDKPGSPDAGGRRDG